MGMGCRDRGLWQLLALDDEELEKADLVRLNLTVAREVPRLRSLDIDRYCRIVDGWSGQFARALPDMEAMFHKTPWKWKKDIHFFRVGMLAGFLGHEIGIRYKDEQKQALGIRYTNPSDLFLNGLIDTHEGTCGSMPTLHAAISRRMGWPVGLAAVHSHFISRYDDGGVYHNIEATDTHPGGFASGTDEEYIRRYNLPKRAVACGSDLRKLTAREMLGIFVGFRARHFADIDGMKQADLDSTLARVLAPRHRRTFLGGVAPMLGTGSRLFEPGETGHPNSLTGHMKAAWVEPPLPSPSEAPGPTARLHVITIPIAPTSVSRPQNGIFSALPIAGQSTLQGT